jgi:hypothetical protein
MWQYFLFAAKLILDFRGDNLWGAKIYDQSSYERPEFILMPQGKNSSYIVLCDPHLGEVQKLRAQGYQKIIAYLMEPRSIKPGLYEYVERHLEDFDLILTFDEALLLKYPEHFRFIHAAVPNFIQHQAIHPKTKLCSAVFGKTDYTDGHRLRKEIAVKLRSYFDVCKTDETPRTDWKDAFINDFCFSVAVENSRARHYFTEKILDCFRAGTIPIYWGCPSIGEFFDEEGIITFSTLEELEGILKNLSFEEYEKRRAAVYRNFELAKKYPAINFKDRPSDACAVDCVWRLCFP